MEIFAKPPGFVSDLTKFDGPKLEGVLALLSREEANLLLHCCRSSLKPGQNEPDLAAYVKSTQDMVGWCCCLGSWQLSWLSNVLVWKKAADLPRLSFFAHFEFFRNLQNSCEEIWRKQMHNATAWTKVCFKYLPNYFKISAPMRRRMVRSRRTSRTHRFHMPLSDSCMVIGGFDRTVLVSAVLLAPAVAPPALPRVRLWQLRCAFIFHSRRAQALAHCSPSRKEAASLPVLVTWATSAWVCRYLEAEVDSWL